MEVNAKLRYLRVSPRKVRLVVDLIRGLHVKDAKSQLKLSPKGSSLAVLKLLNSATANAVNNFNLDENNLFVKKALVDMGPTLHRWKPRAFGKASPIRKRTTHITLVLDELEEGKVDIEKQVVDTLPKEAKLNKEKTEATKEKAVSKEAK